MGMTWEYRVLHEEHEVPGGTTESTYSLIEAYYKEGTEEVELWSQPEDTRATGETVDELVGDLVRMLRSCWKPPLNRRDLPGGDPPPRCAAGHCGLEGSGG